MSANETPKRSLFKLIADLPTYIVELVKSELEQLKSEIVGKLKMAGIGIGAFVVAGAFAFFALGVLVAAAILGLATVLPGWAAALIVAGVLLLITGILVVVGINLLKKGTPPTPTDTIASVKEDVNAFKGTGKRD
jgi:ABC-type transport system involved in multi-copper enzyme maturation permease subunit